MRSNKIDKEWTCLFWNVMLKKSDEKEAPDINPKMMNFIRFIITNDYAGVEQLPEGQKTNDSLEYLVGTVSTRGKEDYNNYISFYLFSGLSQKSTKGGGERSYAFIKKEADDLQILVWYKDAKYEVGFNNNSKDPEIEKVLAENKTEAVDADEYGDNAFIRTFDTDEETIKFMEKLSSEL
jgi:hypothetical protein